MSATYSPTLDGPYADRHWCRLQIGDRDVDNSPEFQDEEIDAILAEESNKWLAAARLGEIILGRKKDVVSKAVGDLRLTYGAGGEDNAYRQHLKMLREKGAELLQPTPRPFRVL
jgi:hypothetical protein